MDAQKDPGQDLLAFIADYMERGFFENIIDMFRHDPSLYGLVGSLITDARIRVRLGITALMEELRNTDAGSMRVSLQGLIPLLDHPEAVVRGDAANLLGIVGDPSVLPLLEKALTDENRSVQDIAREAIGVIRQRNPKS